MAMTVAQRVLNGRIGAAVARSRHDVKELTAAGRQAFLLRFERQIRADHPELPEPEIARRAREARIAHMLKLASLSAKARAKKQRTAGQTRPTALEVRDASATPPRAA